MMPVARNDAVVPAALIGRTLAVPAADIEAVLGAGHGDVEQAILFLARAFVHVPAPGAGAVCRVGGAWQPEPQVAVLLGQQPLIVARHARGVGQVDDRSLQALGGVHRQDSHFLSAVGVEVALDVAAAFLEPAYEALQRCRLGTLVLQRARQQFVDRIGSLAAQPLEQPPAAFLRPQRLGEEVEWRDEIGAG